MTEAIEHSIEQRLTTPMLRAGLRPSGLLVRPAPPARAVWQADTGRWWYIAEPQDDPMIRDQGYLDVPPHVSQLFQKLAVLGFDPDDIRIGHEFPDGVDPRSLIEQPARLAPPIPRGLARSAKVAGQTVPVILKGAGTVAVGVATVIGGLLAALAQIDPVVIAGIRVDDENLAWVEVARWKT